MGLPAYFSPHRPPLYRNSPQRAKLQKLAKNLNTTKSFALYIVIQSLATAILFGLATLDPFPPYQAIAIACCATAFTFAVLAGMVAAVAALAQKYIETKFQ